METTFYEDSHLAIKKGMKLELALPAYQLAKQNTPSCDLNFSISTPELERLINNNHSLLLTTPTSNSLFPKNVTEEQEAYARGFVDALGKLHSLNTPVYTSLESNLANNTAKPILPTTVNHFNLNHTTTIANSPQQPASSVSGLLNHNNLISNNFDTHFYQNKNNNIQNTLTTNNTANIPLNHFSNAPEMLEQNIKSELYHTVPHSPSSSRSSTSPPNNFSPINMQQQEVVKLERKRARNRVAATKCRNRKLERILRLEQRVSDLKEQNVGLVRSADQLRCEVAELKRSILGHTRQGCQVMLTSKFLDFS